MVECMYDRLARSILKCATRFAHFVVLVSGSVFVGSLVHAAVPVEESIAEGEPLYRPAIQVPDTRRQPPAQPRFQQPRTTTADGAGDDRRLSELFYQLQILQQEVQELRGLIEEQSYQLNRLARDQQEQYIDLDRRIAQMTTALPGAGDTLAGGRPPGAPGQSRQVFSLPGRTNSSAGGGERAAYRQAFDLMEARQFEESVREFNRLIVDYPNGQLTPNAFYWLGELYLLNDDTEQARQSFAQVINIYPDHPKIADTLYKLGIVYHRLGDTSRSIQYFDRVQADYPASSAAGLAANYASEIR